MRLLLDANIPLALAVKLRAEGHDVICVTEWRPHANDRAMLETARQEQRVLVTQDLWFGNIRLHQAGVGYGVVLVRPKALTPTEVRDLVETAVRDHGEDLFEKLTVVDRNRVRMSDFPNPQS